MTELDRIKAAINTHVPAPGDIIYLLENLECQRKASAQEAVNYAAAVEVAVREFEKASTSLSDYYATLKRNYDDFPRQQAISFALHELTAGMRNFYNYLKRAGWKGGALE